MIGIGIVIALVIVTVIVVQFDTDGLATVLLASAIGLALLIGVPLGLVTLGNTHHDSACTTLRTEGDRLACLTGGTVQAKEVAACEGIQSDSTSGFIQCMSVITATPYTSVHARSTTSGVMVGNS